MNKGYTAQDYGQAAAYTGRLDAYPKTAAEVVGVGGYAVSPVAEAVIRANDKAGQLAGVIDGLISRLQPALSAPYPATPGDPRPTSETDLVREIDNLGEAFEYQTARLRDVLTRLAL